MERPRAPSCLYIMRATFLLPLARVLAAFYRAIKAVNQSLLNDLCFLTCFTGGGETGTVAAVLHAPTWKRPGCATHTSGCLDSEYTMSVTRLLRGQRASGCTKRRTSWRRNLKQEFRQRVVLQLPMYSCRVVLATAFNSHKFGSTGYI